MTTLAERLVARCSGEICSEALEWLGGQQDHGAAWAACPRGEWLLWVLLQAGLQPPRHAVAQRITYFAFDYAALVLRAWPELLAHSDALVASASALDHATEETVDEVLAAARTTAEAARAAAQAIGATGADDAALCAIDATAGDAFSAAHGAAGAAGVVGEEIADEEREECAGFVLSIWPAPPVEVLMLVGLSPA